MTLPTLDPYGWWLAVALLLAIAEIVAPGVFLVWLAAAAALTGLVTLLLGIPIAAQFALFSVAAVAAIYGGRRWLTRHPILSDDPMLNDRVARLIGRQVTVVDAITGGEGRVRVDDGVWRASGPDAPRGAQVRIVAADGGLLEVEPL